jgi:hypothetical protein
MPSHVLGHGRLTHCDARPNEQSERVEQRDDDRPHACRLSENAGNLNRRNTFEVLGSHGLLDTGPRYGCICLDLGRSLGILCPGAQLHPLHFSAVPRVAVQVVDQG